MKRETKYHIKKLLCKTMIISWIISFVSLNGCSKNNNPVVNSTEIDSLIFSKDSISKYSSVNSIDTVYRDTTINKLKVQYDLYTNDLLPDSSVSSGFFISGIPSEGYQTFGKYNNGFINYSWKADTNVNYLHIGFGVSYIDSSNLNIKMYNIKVYRVY